MNDGLPPASDSAVGATHGYRVLARKYRPVDFSGLIGQEAMVRTLANAISQGRLAHGFMLTGVRGVGKTTTARILARCFNCVGRDGASGPTAKPCGTCEHCLAITEDRHVDVIEMDAASRTGIDDIRELIEGVRYRPVSARYKVYIVDEVHMLSEKAFNALLKTLEEPPPHVKFIFATTEIRKVPVTVLSRCQRFDLRRVAEDELAKHFAAIAEAEGATIAPEALRLIARAADGSVRDGLSLLDQAIALAPAPAGSTTIGESAIREMLGLADRTQLIELYQSVLDGRAGPALDQLSDMYRAGADPSVILQDMLLLTHWLTRTKVAPAELDDPATPEAERNWAKRVGPPLGLALLARFWQMLLKGLAETQQAPQPLAAAEMAVIRLIHASNLPDPIDLVRRLSGEVPGAAAGERTPARPTSADGATRSGPAMDAPRPGVPGANALAKHMVQPQEAPQPQPRNFEDIVELFKQHREGLLSAHLQGDVHLVRFEPGRIEFRPGPKAPANLANRIAQRLAEWTGQRWLVSISQDEGAPTMREQAASRHAALIERACAHPLVKAAMTAFPGAKIESVRDLTPSAATANPSGEPTGEDEAI